MVATAEEVEEGTRMEQGEMPFADVDRVAWLVADQVERMEPCVVRDAGHWDRCRSRKSCYGCSHPGHCDSVAREASYKHTLADRVVGGSSLSNQRRRRRSRGDDDGAVCVSGDARLVAAPPVARAHDGWSFRVKSRSAGDFCVDVPLPDRDTRPAHFLAAPVGRIVR